jgi:hypothetical protein
MLLGVALATSALVAACVVSVVFRPDPEALRPIDGQIPEEPGEGRGGIDGVLREAGSNASDESSPTAG